MDTLEQQAQEAIAAGANPEQVYARLNAMREQMQPQQQAPQQQNENPAMRGMPGMPVVADEAFANHLKATGKNIGRNIVNIPHNISESIPAVADPNRNYFQEYGIEQGLPDDILQAAIEYSPFGLGAAKAVSKIPALAKGFKNVLASGILGNAAYGAAANKDDRAKGAAIGGAIGAGAPIAGKVVDKAIIAPAAKFIAQQSGKPLAKKATELLKKSGIEPQQAAKELKKTHDLARKESKAAWGEAENRAKVLDELQQGLPNSRFSAKPYNDVIKNYEAQLAAKEPAEQVAFQRALEFLNYPKTGGKAIAPQSFKGVIANRKGINNAIDDFLETKQLSSNRELEGLSNQLKGSLNDVIDKNTPAFAKARGALFKDSWEDANKATQRLNEFYDAPQKLGIDKTHKQMKELFKSNNAEADGALIKIFTPQPGQTGSGGFDKLSELVGKDKAKSYLKGYMFRKVDAGNSIEALDIYHGLSPAQRKAIFGDSKEGKLLESASRVWSEIGKDKEKFFSHMPWMHGLSAAGIPGLVAGGAALAAGEPWENSLGIGLGVGAATLGAGKGVANLSPNFLTIPKVATRLAAEGRSNPGGLTARVLQAEANKGKK